MICSRSIQPKRIEAIEYIKSLNSNEINHIKDQYIQYFCDFYDEYSDLDKAWFARQFNSCLDPIELYNSCMFIWMIPLFILSKTHKEKSG